MARSRLLVLAGLALTAVLMAMPAQAAPKGDCLWNKTPKVVRDNYLGQYRVLGADALSQMKFGDELGESFKACGVADNYEANFEAGAILGAMIMENGSELVLSEQASMPVGALPNLWRGLPESDREKLRVMARGMITKGSDEAANTSGFAVIKRLLDEAGLSDALDVHFAIYFVARATRDVLEAGGMPKPADRS